MIILEFPTAEKVYRLGTGCGDFFGSGDGWGSHKNIGFGNGHGNGQGDEAAAGSGYGSGHGEGSGSKSGSGSGIGLGDCSGVHDGSGRSHTSFGRGAIITVAL
jgi:hypothetical protein